MNEIANVCDLFGADVDHVRKAVGSDRRIGSSFLFPGVGYGGSCFPKDVKALTKFSSDKKYDFRILKAVEQVNESQKRLLLRKMQEVKPAKRTMDQLATAKCAPMCCVLCSRVNVAANRDWR